MFWHVQIASCLENFKKKIEELKLDADANKNININAACITGSIKSLIADIHGGPFENVDLNTDITAFLQQYPPKDKQDFLQRLNSLQEDSIELFSCETDAVKQVLDVQFEPLNKALAEVKQALTANLQQPQIITAHSSPVAIFPTLNILAAVTLLSEVKQNKLPVVLLPNRYTSTARTINQFGAEAFREVKAPDLTNLRAAAEPFIPGVTNLENRRTRVNGGGIGQRIKQPNLPQPIPREQQSGPVTTVNLGGIKEEIERKNIPTESTVPTEDPTEEAGEKARFAVSLANWNTLEQAIVLFEKLGRSPYHPTRFKCNNRAELQKFMQEEYGFNEATFDRMFKYTQGADFKWTCEVRWDDINFSVHSDKIDEINTNTNSTGKNDVTHKVGALLYEKLQEPRHLHLAKLLLKVPPHTGGNPTSTLLEFLNKHSIYQQGDELQGIYRYYMRSISGSTMPIFECKLTFNGTELTTGRGDTKRRAREQASRQALKLLNTVMTNFLSKPENKNQIDESLKKFEEALNDQREQEREPARRP